MNFTVKVLLWMVAGLGVGFLIQETTAAPATSGIEWTAGEGGIVIASVSGPAKTAKLKPGPTVTAVVTRRGKPDEARVPLTTPEDFERFVSASENGQMVWLEQKVGEPLILTLGLDPGSGRAKLLVPFDFVAEVFMLLLKMLIVPLVFTSIIVGVAGLGGGRELGRLGGKAFTYYVSTSLLAILVGQVLVTAFRPGDGAELGLSPVASEDLGQQASFLDILKGMVPENTFLALTDNGAMLKIIFFALLFGFFITRTPEPHQTRVRQMVESVLQVVMMLARGVLGLIPYGVFALVARVVANTGFAVFQPLLIYMGVVALALVLHATVTLPLILRIFGGISPLRWAKAMSPALMTAFSTSSSSMTLPVTMETVEHRGRVSKKLASFTLPIGATVNMDGTALYECIGVIFLAQYYAGINPDYTLTLADQGLVVLLALMASVGAAGIPSAGLVMMVTILAALRLPVEGAALLLAVDRPLDMLRTMVNVWSDGCGAAVIARSEGETGPLEAGALPAPPPAGTT
jgi:Na+/H+-dicarboxylate symporter